MTEVKMTEVKEIHFSRLKRKGKYIVEMGF